MRTRRGPPPLAPDARPFVLTAARVYVGDGRWLAGGGLVIDRDRVMAVLNDARAVARTVGASVSCVDAGEVVLAPGLVVAHAHLELSALAGRVPRGRDFVEWITTLMRERAAIDRAELARERVRAATAMLRRGATTIADVDSLKLSADRRSRPSLGVGPRLVIQRELLDAHDPERTANALRNLWRAVPRGRDQRGALAPHAPHTVSADLLAGAARVAARTSLPISVHWAESEEEVAWLAGRGGPFERLLGPSRVGPSGLERLAAADLLGPRTALVHANHPEEGDRERVARAGCTIVHCPGAHRFFDRAPFPFDAWREAGVPLALGTDSAAGNDALDPLREIQLARASAPGIPPLEWLAMATAGGARAVGFPADLGHLGAGALADVVAWPLRGDSAGAFADALTSGELSPSAVWVGGRPASV